MQQRLACLRAHPGGLEFVQVAQVQCGLETHAAAVGSHGHRLDRRLGGIDLRRSVVGLVNIGEGAELVGLRLARGLAIHGFGEGEFKSIGLDVHFVDFERGLAAPVHPLEGKGLAAASTPSTVGPAHEQRAVGGHFETERAAVETLAEGEAGALIHAIDLFQVHPHDRAPCLVADEELVLERTKFSGGAVVLDARGALAHFVVGESDGRRHELRDLGPLNRDAAVARRILRPRTHVRGLLVPAVARGVAYELPGLQVLEPTGAIPGPLVVGVEHFAQMVGGDAAGRTQSAGGGDGLAVRGDAQSPSAVRILAREGTREAEDDPDVAVAVELRTKGVFVVVAVNAPAVGHSLEEVGATVVIGVLEAREFAALRGVNPSIAPGRQPKHLMQA